MRPALFPLLPFAADETTCSWAARMAAFHARSSVGTFLRDLNLDPHLMALGDRDEIGRLCEIAGQDPRPVLGNTLTRLKGSAHALGRDMMRTILCPATRIRFCPACIALDDAASVATNQNPAVHRRERLIWRFRPVRTCPHHGVDLECRVRPADNHVMGAFGEIGPGSVHLLTSIDYEGELRSASSLQRYVAERISGNATDHWLDTVPLEQVVRFSELLGAILLHGPRTFLEDLSEPELCAAGAVGWTNVSHGEQSITRALHVVHAQHHFDVGSKARSFRDTFYNLVEEVEYYPSTSPFRALLRRHVEHSALN
ncbi:TniQ family protein [Paracoccus sp. R12_1]|uniref:TniQ family protein n=1 Tax=unclassified Paracoccus (in: a-proteobacteria) TaxID=2688777 RepID=UPI001AD96808|nr:MULTISPECIES: TniQ family protein [unclassified Paracoccus (in: a-proteobacteria)]MBO9456954.1 TniQ family protein [Paracoccus sp. R12_2]MBO9488047.1 TniQ family protein [Paracoccus sp. R12_1]